MVTQERKAAGLKPVTNVRPVLKLLLGCDVPIERSPRMHVNVAALFSAPSSPPALAVCLLMLRCLALCGYSALRAS